VLRLWLVLALAGWVQPSPDEGFSTELPLGVPALTGWEQQNGDRHDQQVHVTYQLYVNPRLQGLYQVIRYRAQFLHPGTTLEREYRSSEKLIWNQMPGQRWLRCFERQDRAKPTESWHEMEHGTPEYDAEMQMTIRLLALHRASVFEGSAH